MTEEGFVIGDTKVSIPEDKREMLKGKGYAGKELILGVRPEDIYTKASDIESNAQATFQATIEVAELMGAETYLYAALNGSDFIARIDSDTSIRPTETIPLAFDMAKAHFFDAETEERIY